MNLLTWHFAQKRDENSFELNTGFFLKTLDLKLQIALEILLKHENVYRVLPASLLENRETDVTVDMGIDRRTLAFSFFEE